MRRIMVLSSIAAAVAVITLSSCDSVKTGNSDQSVPKHESSIAPEATHANLDFKATEAKGDSHNATKNEISIDNFTFSPQKLTIEKGTTVTWTNKDDVPHTVRSTTNAFKSVTLDTDDKFVFTFNEPGTFPYFCTVHSHMTGEIIVK